MSLSCASAFVKFYSLTGSKLPDLEVQNDLNRNPETSEHFSEIRRAEEKISLFSGSSLSVTSCLSNEANTNLIAHNNDRLPLRTSSLSEETKTNLIAHNNSGYSFCLMYKTLILKIEVTLLFQQLIIAESQHYSLPRGSGQSNNTKCSCQHRPSDLKIQRLLQ